MPARKKPGRPIGRKAPRKGTQRKMKLGGQMNESGLNPPGGKRAGQKPDPNQPDAWNGSRWTNWGAIAYGSVGTMISLNTTEGEDKLTDTVKTTSGYFSSGGGSLIAGTIYTGSLADSNEKYYFNITQTHPDSASAETQFSVAYGHAGGSGSDTDAGDVRGPTAAIYGQLATTFLGENEVSGGFRISTNEGSNPTNKTLDSGVRDEDVYVLVGKRERYKDRINKKNWTIILSGSTATGSGATVHLTDDSDTTKGTGTVAGRRYNIVSGTLGTAVGDAASDRVFGWFYPEMGTMIFSQAELSASISGPGSGSTGFSSSHAAGTFEDTTRITASFVKGGGGVASESMGFAPNLVANANPANALRFINCLQQGSSEIKMRAEEDKVSVSYFCRVRAKDLNFSNNPTFVSGSHNEISNPDMWGNPQVYITGIGLYGTGNTLVAIGKLSTSLKKNFSTESTIKVKLTY